MGYQECTTCEGAGQTCVNSPGQTDTPADNPPADNPPADNPPADNPPAGGDTGSTCPAACKTAYELPANKDTLCQGEMTPTGCSEMDVPVCTSVFKAVCGAGDCPAGCAAALKDSKNYDTVCGDNKDDVLPSPCVTADGLNCVGEIAVACMGDGKDEPGMCTNAQNLVILGALVNADTPECKRVQQAIDADEDPTDKEGCDCFASGADFSALKTFDCKMDEGKDNVSVLVNGGGVCSSSSAFSLFFAVAALFFSLA